jgi:hypothetical protein
MIRIISFLFLLVFSWKTMAQTEPKADILYQNKSLIYSQPGDTTKVSQTLNGDEKGLIEFERRQQILALLEDYKTAYSRKDYALISQFLSKSEFILQDKKKSQSQTSGSESADPRMTTITKQDFLQNLRKVFEKEGLIEVTFEGIKITQHPRYPEVYGVNLRQSWKSSEYKDEGYLFLMIDFEDGLIPVIQISAWQPFQETSEKEIITLSDIFYKKN